VEFKKLNQVSVVPLWTTGTRWGGGVKSKNIQWSDNQVAWSTL
jgi:hypothetical protein